MFIYIHTDSKQVVYFTQADSTFLQSLEGTHLQKIETEAKIPFPRKESTKWCWTGETFTESVAISDAAKLLARKAELLHRVQLQVTKVRTPFTKLLLGQESIYAAKHREAVEFLKGGKPARDFPYLQDEVEITRKDPKTLALEIMRQRSERDWIFRCSERARRLLTDKICKAATLPEVNALEPLLKDRNFKLPFDP